MSSQQRAFSLIELLMVITIIAILAGLILAVSSRFTTKTNEQKTSAIIGALRTAVRLNAAERSGIIGHTEHPLAGSREPRGVWLRANGSIVPAPESSGMAFVGVDADQVQASQVEQLMLDDDVFADPLVPILYGLKRTRIGIIGNDQADITQYRKLPKTLSATTDPSTVGRLVVPSGSEEGHQKVIGYVMTAGIADELRNLDAFKSPDAEYAYQLTYSTNNLVRAYSNEDPNFGGTDSWEAGRVGYEGNPASPGNERWFTYRLPGQAIYDAWGREIIYAVLPSGHLHIESAGEDGVFRWHPGEDGAFQTAANDSTASGDDLDGSEDNIGASTITD